MREWRPQVVVSAGSYVSVPVIWAAHHLGIHTLIHQQDVRPGLANKLMAPAADRITVAFESSLKDFPRRKVTWTGNPVRPSIFQGSAATAREIFHLPTTQPVLLVIGGGTGSAHLNQVVGSAAYKLVRQWSVIHITGQQRDFPELHHEHYVATPFLTWQIPHALALADLVICRAGLGTFSELAALAKSAIFVPMPDSHQEDNARVIREAQAGVVIPQSRFDQQRLLAETDRLLAAANERATLGQRLHRFYRPKALVDLTDEVLRLTAQ
ncbi:MAG: glycosyltransferase [Candidatus Kerfeldbacteria bacterium]|nr:glycosyltransferase [Candidatus Kerfeldbacteria bacterium]